MRSRLSTFVLALLVLSVAPALAQDLPATHILKAIPAGAKEVAPAAKAAKPGDAVTLRGRVAASSDAFAEGRAEFVLVDDTAAASVLGMIDGAIIDRCPLEPANRALVRLIDSKGATLTYALKGRSGLEPGAEVFVKGTVAAAATEDTPVVVHATGLHVPRGGGLPAGFLLEKAPDPAPDVADAKAGLKKGDTVTLKGRIGGMKEPFVAGRAMFTLAGHGIKACNEIPGDACKFPWDFCCVPRDQIHAHSATVQVVDAKGAPVKTDIKGRWDIKELSEVVVVGTVAVAEGKTLVVNATGIHVIKP